MSSRFALIHNKQSISSRDLKKFLLNVCEGSKKENLTFTIVCFVDTWAFILYKKLYLCLWRIECMCTHIHRYFPKLLFRNIWYKLSECLHVSFIKGFYFIFLFSRFYLHNNIQQDTQYLLNLKTYLLVMSK